MRRWGHGRGRYLRALLGSSNEELIARWREQEAPLLPLLHAFHDRDGFLSDDEHPVHTYPSEGNYTVTHLVTGPGGTDSIVKENLITVLLEGVPFLRGDADGNGVFNGLVDGLFILAFAFIPGSAVPLCMDAVDADDDGIFNGLLEGLYVLNFAFVPGNPPPPPPGVDACGIDPTADDLNCQIGSCP